MIPYVLFYYLDFLYSLAVVFVPFIVNYTQELLSSSLLLV